MTIYTPLLQQYKSDEITITPDPKNHTHFSFSTILDGTKVYFTIGSGYGGQKIVTAKQTSTPPYIFVFPKVGSGTP